MANIFFFGVDVTSGNAGGAFILGPIEITVGQICVGVISSLMVFPANLLVVQMFRLSRAPPEKIAWKFWKWKKTKKAQEGEEEKSKEEIEKDKLERMDEKAEDELQQQLSFLEDGDDSRRLLKSRSSKKVSFEDPTEETKRTVSKDEGFEDEGSDEDDDGEKKKDGEDGDGFHLVGGIKKTEKKKKAKFMLPWQCFLIGWFAGLCTVGTAFYMTIQIAGQFGKEKATEWLQTMCCSLLQDIIFSQPLKVSSYTHALGFTPTNQFPLLYTLRGHLSQLSNIDCFLFGVFFSVFFLLFIYYSYLLLLQIFFNISFILYNIQTSKILHK